MASTQHLVEFEDLRYNIMEDNDDYIASKFKWLDKYMLYLPLFVTKLPSTKPRAQSCKLFIWLLISFFMIYCIGFTLGLCVAFVQNSKEDVRIFLTMNHVFFYLNSFLTLIQRIFSLIYYYFYFSYPWYSNDKISEIFPCNQAVTTTSKRNCMRINYKVVLQTFLVLYFVSTIVVIVGAIVYLNMQGNILVYAPSFENIFANLSFYVAMTVHAVICYKYHYYLSKIIDYGLDDLDETFLRYKILYDAFKNDNNFYLKWTVLISLFKSVTGVWFGAISPLWNHNNFEDDVVRTVSYHFASTCGCLQVILSIVLYIVSSTYLSEQFERFRDVLWDEKGRIIEMKRGQREMSMMSSLILFTGKYRINISVGSLEMTKKNILLFALTFVGARIFTLLKYVN